MVRDESPSSSTSSPVSPSCGPADARHEARLRWRLVARSLLPGTPLCLTSFSLPGYWYSRAQLGPQLWANSAATSGAFLKRRHVAAHLISPMGAVWRAPLPRKLVKAPVMDPLLPCVWQWLRQGLQEAAIASNLASPSVLLPEDPLTASLAARHPGHPPSAFCPLASSLCLSLRGFPGPSLGMATSHSLNFSSMRCPCSFPRRLMSQCQSVLPGPRWRAWNSRCRMRGGKLLLDYTRLTSCQNQTARKRQRVDPSVTGARTMHIRLRSC